MIKAIIFDCFGVLVAGSLEQFIDKHFSKNEELSERAHAINDQASLGRISYDQQLYYFASMANIDIAQARAEMDTNPRNNLLLSYIKDNLKGSYKLGFLSNASDNWLESLFEKDDINLFNDFVLSYAVGMAKPDVRIYELAAKRLGVEPESCLFVDDIARYCEAAELAGMKAIHYKSFRQFLSEINKLLEVADTDK